jgi:hypothetical protein
VDIGCGYGYGYVDMGCGYGMWMRRCGYVDMDALMWICGCGCIDVDMWVLTWPGRGLLLRPLAGPHATASSSWAARSALDFTKDVLFILTRGD